MFKGVARQNNTPCWLCNGKYGPIDWNAPPQTPKAFELDHAQPLSTHPELAYEPTNFRASHSLCNRKRGNTHIPTTTRPTTWIKAIW